MAVDVCHLSVLNPPKHPRIFHREALSQAKAGLSVCVIAQSTGPELCEEEASGIRLIGLPLLERSSLTQRIRRAWRLVQAARRQNARIVQLHAPELLLPALVLKPFTGWKVVYDMHEDYPRQLRDSPGWPTWLRRILAAGVRLTELATAPFLNYVWYAEESYRGNLTVAATKCDVLGNYYAGPAQKPLSGASRPFPFPTLLYSGTLGETGGLDKALDLWRRLNLLAPVGLIVAGHAPLRETIPAIRQYTSRHQLEDRLIVDASDKPIAYDKILHWIATCDAGLALYRPLPWLVTKIPSKFYEYMSQGKPLVFTANPYWNRLNSQWQLGLSLEEDTSTESVLHWLETAARSWAHPPAEIWSWEIQAAPKLVRVTRRLLGR